VALAGMAVSPDGKLLAYSTAASGSDWNEIRVRDVDTGKDLEDHIQWVKFSSTAWTRDGKGFFYSRYDEPKEATKLADVNYFQKLYFHKLGTPQSADVLVYDRPDEKEWGFGATTTDDGRYLLITATKGTAHKYRVFYKDLSKPDSKVHAADRQLRRGLRLHRQRRQRVLLRHRPQRAAQAHRRHRRQQAPGSQLEDRGAGRASRPWCPPHGQQPAGNAEYLADARSVVKVVDLKGKAVREIALPGIGSVSGFGGKRGDTETFFSFTGFTTPTTIYRLDMKSGAATVFRKPDVKFNPADYETRQQFYTSRDGTRVPMFIVSKKGLKLDGSNPTYLYGYGGFNISMTPGFSPANLAWMEMGGVYVVANLRGGGEYGEPGTRPAPG
jgi:prolyl oligopeptidase